MRRIPALFALVLPLSLGLASLAPAALEARTPAHRAATNPAAKARPAAARPALWKVADADTTIWLFGTIHALPPGINWFHGPIATALKGADELVTEIPETDPARMQAAVLQHAVLPAGQSLRAMMSEPDRTRFEQAMRGFGLPPEAFDRFEPWYAAVALTALPLAKSGYTAANGVEERIAAEARALGRPRSGLETADTQLAMFDSLPLDVQRTYLHQVVDGLPTLDTQLGAIIREWQGGHADRLARLLNDQEDDPRMVTALLTNRNRAWTSWVQQRLARPGVIFMAVGAGHLAGKDSVQDMLRQRGIRAIRVQ